MSTKSNARGSAANALKAAAAKQAQGDQGVTPTHVRVIAMQEGGRHRAGRHWPDQAVEVSIDEFSEEQLEQLLTDPKLSVTFAVIEAQANTEAEQKN